MKKIIITIILTSSVVLFAEGQRKGQRWNQDKMTSKQKATLMVKKMTLALDLSDTQQKKIQPLLLQQIQQKESIREKMWENRGKRDQVSSQERFERANKRLDDQIAFHKAMKSVLNDEQFDEFQKMSKKKRRAQNKKMEQVKKRMALKKRNWDR